jgi:hypothetical protein
MDRLAAEGLCYPKTAQTEDFKAHGWVLIDLQRIEMTSETEIALAQGSRSHW